MAERAFSIHKSRLIDPQLKTFGKILAMHGTASDTLARSRFEIEQAVIYIY